MLGRIVCQLVNEACFAVGEGVGTPEDVDAGMVLGLNHPRGPLDWGDAIGLDHVLAVLDGLYERVPRGALPRRAGAVAGNPVGNTAPFLSAGCPTVLAMRRLPLLTLLLALALAAPAQADLKPPMVLPGDAGAASAADWIVGAQPSAAADAVAARHGAGRIRTYVVPTRPCTVAGGDGVAAAPGRAPTIQSAVEAAGVARQDHWRLQVSLGGRREREREQEGEEEQPAHGEHCRYTRRLRNGAVFPTGLSAAAPGRCGALLAVLVVERGEHGERRGRSRRPTRAGRAGG